MTDRKVTLVLDEADADLLADAVRAGAVAWSIQGKDEPAKQALQLSERVRAARRHGFRGTSSHAGWQGAR